LVSFINNEVSFIVHCSSGTYIRSLCFDLGAKLGYPSLMSNLRRLASGTFTLEQAYTLEQVQAGEFQLYDIKEALNLDTYQLNQQEYNDVLNGKPLSINQANNFLVCDNNNQAIALYGPSQAGVSKIIRGLW
ncbi:MAG: tRNA pseudouridine(55) synthase TruB, partial [Bacilli bacterium]